jgi:hypothetical protein
LHNLASIGTRPHAFTLPTGRQSLKFSSGEYGDRLG